MRRHPDTLNIEPYVACVSPVLLGLLPFIRQQEHTNEGLEVKSLLTKSGQLIEEARG